MTRERCNEYLWQGTGPEDEFVRELENVLAPFWYDTAEDALELERLRTSLGAPLRPADSPSAE
jgi:hypothetical protein